MRILGLLAGVSLFVLFGCNGSGASFDVGVTDSGTDAAVDATHGTDAVDSPPADHPADVGFDAPADVGVDAPSDTVDTVITDTPADVATDHGAGSCTDGVRNGAETDVDCGGPVCPACADFKTCVLSRDCISMTCDGICEAQTVLSINESSSIAVNNYSVATMSGFSNPYMDNSMDAAGIAFTGTGLGVVVVRSALSGGAGELRYATWNGSWSPGFAAAMLPVRAAPALDILGGPSIAGSATRAHCAYQGTDMNFYYAEFDGTTWSPSNESITSGGTASTGPLPPAITTLHDVPILAYVGSSGDLYDQTRSGGTWSAPNSHGVAGHAASITPAIVALTHGPELLLVYVDNAAHGLMYAVRTAGTWSAPAPITGASSTDPVSVAPLVAGGAVLVYKGIDNHLYTSLFAAGPPSTWSAPVAGVMGASPTLQSPPVVATGANGAQAELLYLDSSFVLQRARMMSGAWGAATFSGSASFRLAIATGH